MVCWLYSYTAIRMIYLTNSLAQFNNQKWLHGWQQIFRKLLWFPSRMEFLTMGDVIKGYQMNDIVSRKLSFYYVSIGSGWEHAWVKILHSFHYRTWSFWWSRQSGTYLKLYFSFVKTHSHSHAFRWCHCIDSGISPRNFCDSRRWLKSRLAGKLHCYEMSQGFKENVKT